MPNGDHIDPIEHIVVLMLENRSFDQMLGDIPNVSGVDLKYQNILNGEVYQQKPNARNKVPVDPKHLHPNVKFQIESSGANFLQDYWCEYERRSWYRNSTSPNYDDIMDYFSCTNGKRLNVLHTLAETFTVCDQWYSSVPGPTWPNRFFVHSGTSMGYVCMPEGPRFWEHLHWYSYTQNTIYRQLNEAGISCKIYYHDIPQSIVLRDLRNSPERFEPMEKFFSDAAGIPDKFPQYSFIEPRYGYTATGATFEIRQRLNRRPLSGLDFRGVLPDREKLPNDDHPPHTTDQGQTLIRDVYHALIGNDELWSSTLLIVLYDEHGGFYDHVHDLPSATPPDANAPEHITYNYPCGGIDDFDFGFNSLGVRVPAVLISPWVKRSHVCSTIFDHTSILKYVSDKWLRPAPHENPPYLTERIAGTSSIAECVGNGPGPIIPPPQIELRPSEAPQNLEAEANQPLNDHQEALVAFSETLPETAGDDLSVTDEVRLRRREEHIELAISPLGQWALATARVQAFMTRNEMTL